MTDIPLFPTEVQIARAVLGPGRTDQWKALAVVWEAKNFPPIDPLTGGRYWPACLKWFQVRYGLDNMPSGRIGRTDGVEIWPARKRRASTGESEATVHKLHTGSRDTTS